MFRKKKTRIKDRLLLEQFRESPIEPKGSWLKAFGSFIVETLKVVILAGAIILPIRYYLIQPFYVKGASMEPNFFDHEYLMINEISYRFSEPMRGDIVVFRYPRDPKQFFIKRVVGLPGEKIDIREGRVFIAAISTSTESFLLEESSYLANKVRTTDADAGQYVLGPDEYFLLGDNRGHSLDSRNFGPVKRELVVGKVWFRGWPLDRIEIF